MNKGDRNMLSAATLIHEHIARRCPAGLSYVLADYYWKRVATLRRQLVAANNRGWHRAAWQVLKDLTLRHESLGKEKEM
jgi:hypothetical protein